MEGHVIMSKKETVRIPVIEKVLSKRIKQKVAAKELRITIRQVQRIVKKYKEEGVESLRHKSRGKTSNNRMLLEQELKITEIIREKYYDFGPTFASEKLLENEKIKVSNEKLRQLMIKEYLWKTKKVKANNTHQMRERRSREGELVQIDGSPHAWFENRRDTCCLLVYIDDATSKIKWIHFCEKETTNDYFKSTKCYIKKYGIPLSYYSDKHGIFRINTKELNSLAIDKNKGLTQFGRAMKELGIELINAETPQAKGRVERANKTLQDRLVKELRLAGISTIKEANKFAPKFIEKHNQKFAVEAKNMDNAHIEARVELDLEVILSKQEERIISKNLTVQYENKIYQIQTKRSAYTMRKQTVIIIEDNIGELKIIYKGNSLEYKIYERQPKFNKIVCGKGLNSYLDKLLKDSSKIESKFLISNVERI